MMQELSQKEQQQILLNILIEIDKICQINNIEYSLAGGSLLGALRHKGFIPWDDDIDLNMTRPNYNKFIDYCNNHQTPFRLMCHENTESYSSLFMKISDLNTRVFDRVIDLEKYEMGLSIDIFPIDSLGDSYDEAKNNLFKSELYRRILDAKTWKKYRFSKTRSILYEPIRFFLYLMSKFFSTKFLIKHIENSYCNKTFGTARYSGCYCGSYGINEIFDTSIFLEYTTYDFEGIKIQGIKEADVYLKSLYGDYMKLPDENKRQSHHTFNAYKIHE